MIMAFIKVLIGVLAVGVVADGSAPTFQSPKNGVVMGFVPQHHHHRLVEQTTNSLRNKQHWNTIRTLRGGDGAAAAAAAEGTTQLNASLGQYAGAAASLFGNMITPASILGGSIVPIAFASGLDYDGPNDETKFAKFLRKAFPCVAVASLASLLISVMWSSVTVNQLTENVPAKAVSVWHLLQRDYKLEWAGVNSHFVLGMLGYMWLIATKAFFMGGGTPVFTLAMSGMLAMVSIVNRGVARGGGSSAQRYGASTVGLIQTYVSLLCQRVKESFGPVELLAMIVFATSLIAYGNAAWKKIQSTSD